MEPNNLAFVKYLEAIKSAKTVYMWGTVGNALTKSLITSKKKQYPSKYSLLRIKYLNSLITQEYIASDCVGLYKGFLWGGYPKPNKYKVFQDRTCSGLLAMSPVHDRIETIPEIPGIGVYKKGHIGFYICDGKVIECTLGAYGDGVVETNLKGRGWTEWLQLPFMTYADEKLLNDIKARLKAAKAKVKHPKLDDD